MSIFDSKPRKTYAVGATAQAAFAVPFTFWAASDIRVYVDDVRLTSGYTVTGGNGAGGTVTLAAPVTNTTVSVVRRLKIERTTDFPVAGALKTPALNRQLDQHTAILQQLDDADARALTLPENDDALGSPLPPLAQRANRILGFDAAGKPIVSTISIQQMDALTLAALQAGKVAEVIEPFEADGTTSTITTTAPLVAAAQVTLLIGGIIQRPESGAYTVAAVGTGGQITLAEPPPAGVVVGGFVGYATEVGKVVDDVGIVAGHLVIAYVDGETADLGQVVGADGADGADGTNGRGIASATVNGSGRLILTYTDSTTVDAGLVVGGVTSVAGRTGAVTLAVADVSGAAPLASPALTGTPTAPTATVGTNTSQLATTAFVAAALANLIGTAPTTLDTLNELAAALGNDPNFATTITNALAGKAPLGSPAIFTNVVDIRNGGNANALHVGNASGGKFIFVGWDEVNNYGRVGVYASTNAWLNLVINEGGSLTAIGTTTLPTGTAKLNVKDGIQVNGNTVLHTGNTKESIIVALGDETTAITAGAAKVTFRMPYGFTLTDVRGSLAVAGSSATIVNVKRNGGSIFSTKLQIDSGAKTSVGSVVPRVLADTSLADDAEITLDIDTAGTGAKGLKVTLIGRQVA